MMLYILIADSFKFRILSKKLILIYILILINFFFTENKYPELCDLCDDRATCTYNNMEKHGHLGALKCLARRDGKVAYVALSYVNEYLKVSKRSCF